MKSRYLLYMLALSLALVASVQVVHSAPSDWVSIATGIDYQEFQLPDPNNVYVARMDRNNPDVTLESSIAQGKLISGFETVSGMASRYDQAINYWGESWGSRSRVVVAINGSYYNAYTGVPFQGVIHSGWYSKRFWDGENGSGFAWKVDRSPFIGGCIYHSADKQVVLFLDDGETQNIDGLNVPRDDDELILYTPQYDSHTNTSEYGVEVLVEMTRPSMVLPISDAAKGYVREIRKNLGSTFIPFDYLVLSAHGAAKRKLLNNVEVGDEIGISQKINDCIISPQQDWTKTYASVGGGFHFLAGGVIRSFLDNEGAVTRHPRTAIVYNDDHIFFIVIDGRQPEVSIGMTIDELAVFARDTLGATWGIAQDGGGSSTMVVNGEVRNIPSDPCQQLVSPAANQRGPVSQRKTLREIEGLDEQESSSQTCERQVANGMMMVVVEPIEKSWTYLPDDTVMSRLPTEVRLGPGTNYGVLANIPPQTKGFILDHMNDLEGVRAKDSHWWKIAFGDTVGWVPEQSLAYGHYQIWLNLIHR